MDDSAMQHASHDTRRDRTQGFTLIEAMVAVAIVGALAALAATSMRFQSDNQRLSDAAMDIASALKGARSEAIRSGNAHAVFFLRDAQGAVLVDAGLVPVPVLVLDDGRPGSAGQNCRIDGGETIRTVDAWQAIAPGVTGTPGGSPNDLGAGDITTGSSFQDPSSAAASWVMFMPDGAPVSFDAACNLGPLGSGAGAFYLTNGTRTTAVVLMPTGSVRVHSFSGIWST